MQPQQTKGIIDDSRRNLRNEGPCTYEIMINSLGSQSDTLGREFQLTRFYISCIKKCCIKKGLESTYARVPLSRLSQSTKHRTPLCSQFRGKNRVYMKTYTGPSSYHLGWLITRIAVVLRLRSLLNSLVSLCCRSIQSAHE